MTENNFPLFPELSEEGEKEAQIIIDRFRDRFKKIAHDIIDEELGELYSDIIPYIKSDSWSNFRNEIMAGYNDYNNRKIQAEYDFKEIRQKIFEENKEDIIKDLNQDLVEENKKLKETIDWLNNCRSNLII